MADFKIRWAQLDVARQMESIDFIEKFIVLLADSGYNGLFLYLEDRIKTASYQLPCDNEAYSIDEIKHIVSFASRHHIEVIPCVATLGHAERFLRHRELEHLAELQGNMTGRFGGSNKCAFCVTHPDFYNFIGTYLKEVAELFPSQWFHVGLDEFWDFNMCDRCKAAMPTLMDEQKMFIKHILKIREIMQSCGKRIMMWSDMFEFYPDVFKDVSRDIVMVDWQYQSDVRNYLGHLLDVDNENRLAVNAACGFETIAAPADQLLSNSVSYLEYASGKPGVIGGLITNWEKNDNYIFRALPNFVAAGLQMNGMNPTEAFDAMCVKFFGTDNSIFKSALHIALSNGWPRHFEGIRKHAICTRDYYGIPAGQIALCKGIITILQSCRDKVTTQWGQFALDDLLDALLEKSLAFDAHAAAHDIFDNSCTPERRQAFANFRQGFANYLDHMAQRWDLYRNGIKPNVFAEQKAVLCQQLEQLEEYLASNTWIRLNGTLPDGYGVEQILVEYQIDGQWVTADCGVYKPSNPNVGMFCCFIPLEKPFSGQLEAIRLTAYGLGGVGLNFVEVCCNGQHYIPQSVIKLSGRVSEPLNLLDNNTTFAWFGSQSIRYDYFDRHAANQKNSVTLAMQKTTFSNIAMAKNQKL